MADSVMLDSLKGILRLIETFEQETPSESYQTDFIKKMVDQILPHVKKRLESIYLESEARIARFGWNGLFERVKQDVKNGDEYADKGIRLYNQGMETRGVGEVCEIWLLGSGHFLYVKTRSCSHTPGYFSGYRGEVWYPEEWKWKGEAAETENYVAAYDVIEVVIHSFTSFALSYVRDMLVDVKKVDESQRATFIYLLEVLLSKKISVSEIFENLKPEAISILGSYGFHLLSKDPSFHRVSPEVLVRFGRDVVNPLLKIFTERVMAYPLGDIPFTILEALRRIGYDDADVDRLIQSLTDELRRTDPSLEDKRINLVKALGKISHVKIVEPLIAILREDRSKRVLYEAIVALGDICDERAYVPIAQVWPHISQTKSMNEAMERIREQLTEKSIEPLLQTLEDPDLGVCEWAMMGLAFIGNERATDSLIQILFDETKMRKFREVAAIGLGEVGNKNAIQALTRVYKRDWDRQLRLMAGDVLDVLGKRPKSWLDRLLGR